MELKDFHVNHIWLLDYYLFNSTVFKALDQVYLLYFSSSSYILSFYTDIW